MNSTKTNCLRLALLIGALVVWAGESHAGLFGPKGDSTAEKKTNVRQQHDEMLADLYKENPELKKVIAGAAGYATFKQTSVNLFLLATANGYGVMVDHKARTETFMRMGSLGGGIGAGVKDVRVIFVFHDAKVMKQFVEEGWQFGGQADATGKAGEVGVAAEGSGKANVNFKEGTVSAGTTTDVRAGDDAGNKTAASLATRGGMEIYQFTANGLALQATVSGTKYWKDSKLNN